MATEKAVMVLVWEYNEAYGPRFDQVRREIGHIPDLIHIYAAIKDKAEKIIDAFDEDEH